ncbi:hypothetical protein BS47DRAFT_1386791 [Hydnum rufescens UP504]|uniref:RNA-dependent RNA polymerase n=1 Tax=Hydnum rufescens UP504 TaxID=1448309 RepID=A0A9P6BCZ3_9AGAM|nr:hypothetical protein BS47DRAFT_1386791 [Hydnum rufescens UP504]
MSTHDATICVGPSMIKFDAPYPVDVEIAGMFERAKPMYLNRPLIMILETLGVPVSVFQELQQNVITRVDNARSLGPAALLLNQPASEGRVRDPWPDIVQKLFPFLASSLFLPAHALSIARV